MADTRVEDFGERLTGVEKLAAWLEQRVWSGTGNLQERVHVLEDKNVDRVHEITSLKEDVGKVERVLGMNGYADRNVINDLRDALDTIQKLKEGIISTKDFQTLMHDVDTLKKRGQAQIALRDYIMFGIISSMIGIVMQLLMARLITP